MKYILFTTTRCPKCPAIKEYVKQNVKFAGEIMDETNPNFAKLIEEHEVQAAPTFIVWIDNGMEHFRGNEITEIEEFLKDHPQK